MQTFYQAVTIRRPSIQRKLPIPAHPAAPEAQSRAETLDASKRPFDRAVLEEHSLGIAEQKDQRVSERGSPPSWHLLTITITISIPTGRPKHHFNMS